MTRRLSDHEHKLWDRVARTVRPAAGRIMPMPKQRPGRSAHQANHGRVKRATWRRGDATVRRGRWRICPISGKCGAASAIDARLDLHGHTQDTALRELTGFLPCNAPRARAACW